MSTVSGRHPNSAPAELCPICHEWHAPHGNCLPKTCRSCGTPETMSETLCPLCHGNTVVPGGLGRFDAGCRCPTCNGTGVTAKTCRKCGAPETTTKLWTIETGATYCDFHLPAWLREDDTRDEHDDDGDEDEQESAQGWQDQWDEYERIVR